MVLPVIAGIGAYLIFGKEFLGEKLFKQILSVIILLLIGLAGYFIYEVYSTKKDINDFLTDKWTWIAEGAKAETDRVLYDDPRWNEQVTIIKDITWSGEMISQLFGGSAYTAGQTTSQKTYDNFEERYGIEVAEQYEELSGTGRTLVTIGDYITGGIATDAGRKTGELINKYKFW